MNTLQGGDFTEIDRFVYIKYKFTGRHLKSCATRLFWTIRTRDPLVFKPGPQPLGFETRLTRLMSVNWQLYTSLLIAIVWSRLLKRQSKTKRRAPAYSQALRRVREVVKAAIGGAAVSGANPQKTRMSERAADRCVKSSNKSSLWRDEMTGS